MTRQSYLRRRCARRYPVHIATPLRLPPPIRPLRFHALIRLLRSRALIRPLRFSRLDLFGFGLVGASLSPGRGLTLPIAPALCPLPRCCERNRGSNRDRDRTAKAKAKATHRHFRSGVGQSERGHLAEAEPRAPAARSEAAGFPGRPIRDARSAEWELMSALSLTRSVRGDRFQMHHYPLQARGPT